mgnify:CR=1 FL=1
MVLALSLVYVPVLIAGGPRFEDGSEAALGVDRIFGRGTTPGEVASSLVQEMTTRKGMHP